MYNEGTNEIKRNYKDTVFRMIFSDKKELLSLYNAINGTNHTNPDDLTVTTLDNAIYMTVKNDISCVIDMRLNLYEHQSTVNPNMPLRDLDYVSRSYSHFYLDKDIYSPRLIQLPNPKFIVFYNGEEGQPALRELRLSDAFIHNEVNPSLELIVLQININSGYNDELLDNCPALKDYMLYVDRIRKHQKSMSLSAAVNRAVDECIEEGILREFLLRNKAEVVAMSIYEYDEKLHERTMMDIGREEGLEQGREEGLKQGIEQGREEGNIIGKIVAYYDCGKSREEIAELVGVSAEYVDAVLEKTII